MTKLSPAARKVLKAFGTYPLLQDQIPQDLIKALASGIRALADNVYSDEVETCGGASYALVVELDDIYAIADELDAYQL